MQDPQRFLFHDINFHRSLAGASGNPIVASLVEMVSALYYERRRQTAERASERDLRDAAEMHRRIYQAVRSRDAEAARLAMNEHLVQASRHQAQEPADQPSEPGRRARRQRRWRAAPCQKETLVLMAPASFDLTGRVAVVVGGTSGIGRTLALGLADAGADVVPTGRREDLVGAVAGDVEAKGRRSLRVACDVADTASLERARDACLSAFGAIDIVVVAAGTTKRVAVAGDVRRRLGHDHRDESHRDVPVVPGVRGADGRSAARAA